MSGLTLADLVQDRRSDELISLPASASVAAAVALMADREVGAVLIMNDDGLVAGIFSERDLLARVVAAGLDVKSTTLSLVMTRNVKFVSPGTSSEAALALMHLHRFRHLLVIDGP
ncbi:MAG: CBS domain-containing protein, partial [Aquincola sp.]|nr:CBS domain-containing protein [Aquincola sp.]